MKKWVPEKHKNWSLRAEGFKGHVATGGSLLGRAGKWGACGWAVVQLEYDEEIGPLHGMYGSMEAELEELEVQRTIKRVELTALHCLLKKFVGPIKVHVDREGIVDGFRKGEKECIKPRGGRCRFVDQDLGRISPCGGKRNCGGSGACQGTPYKERKERDVAL